MPNFAFQGFGLGEYFKARERLGPLLTTYFSPPLLAPSSFLSLADTLYRLSDAIERLFDENGNPNSNILRSDNKLVAQMMLRISSCGLLETVEELENLLRITAVAGDTSEQKWWNFRTALRLSGLEVRLEEASEKFAFLEWKLGTLFFQCLRRSKVYETLPHLQQIQTTLQSLLLNHRYLYSTPPGSDANSVRTATAPTAASIRSGYPDSIISDSFPIADNRSQYASTVISDCRSEYSVATVSARSSRLNLDAMIQRFQDACEWMNSGGSRGSANTVSSGNSESKFVWRLKGETTILVLVHWIFKTKNYLHDIFLPASYSATSTKQLPIQAYVNLLKSAWILQVSSPMFINYKENSIPEEAAALVALLCCEVITLFQTLHERDDIDLYPFAQMLLHGDFSVVVDHAQQPNQSNRNGVISPSTTSTRPPADDDRLPTPTMLQHPASGSIIHARHGSSDQAYGSSLPPLSMGGSTNNTNSNLSVPVPSPRPLPGREINSASASANSSAYPASYSPPPQSRDGSSSGSSSAASIMENITNTTHALFGSSKSPIEKAGSSSFSSVFPRRGRRSVGNILSNNDSKGSVVSITPSIVPALNDSKAGVYVTPSLVLPQRGRSTSGSSHSGANNHKSGSGIASRIVNYSWGEKLPKPDKDDGGHKDKDSKGGGGGGGAAETRKLSSSGEIEVRSRDSASMIIQASYTGDAYGGRWDDCKVKIFKEYHYTTPQPQHYVTFDHLGPSMTASSTDLPIIPMPPTPETGFTVIRIVTIKEGVEESVDQRFMLLEDTEMVPEYGFHENFPVIYLRKIAPKEAPSPRDQNQAGGGDPEGGSGSGERTNRTKRSASASAGVSPNTAFANCSLPPAVASIASLVFDNHSLFYRFRSAHDMFTFQHSLLGESIESDVRSICSIKYKRTGLGLLEKTEYTFYPPIARRVQLWRETTDSVNSPTLAPQGYREDTAKLSKWAKPDVEGRLKVHTSRVVMFLGRWIVMIFVTDSVECELRSAGEKGNTGERVVRIRPSSYHKSSLMGVVRAKIVGPARNVGSLGSSGNNNSSPPPTTSALTSSLSNPNSAFAMGGPTLGTSLHTAAIRLDKLGLSIEEEENGASGDQKNYGVHTEEFKWFEIEFGNTEEARFFLKDFNHALMDRRRERKRREDLLRMGERGVRMGSIG